jgi:chromate transporter
VNDDVLWQLLLVFAPLSFLSIGGGASIIADIQHQTVSVHHWLSQAQFLDDYAISKGAPGPTSLIVTLIGWQVGGFAGAAVASLAIFVPSAVVFYGLTVLWRRHAFARWRDRLARGLAPISVGLVLASGYSVMTANGGAVSWTVTAIATALLMATRVNPVLILAGGAGIFLAKTWAFP